MKYGSRLVIYEIPSRSRWILESIIRLNISPWITECRGDHIVIQCGASGDINMHERVWKFTIQRASKALRATTWRVYIEVEWNEICRDVVLDFRCNNGLESVARRYGGEIRYVFIPYW